MPDVNVTATGSEGSTSAGTTVVPGTKTDPALLLESLKEEREKRRIAEDATKSAEAKLKDLQDALASGDSLSPEGKALKIEIEELKGTIAVLTQDKTFSELQVKFPALKDNATKFQEFRKNYPPGNDESIAKIFLAENNLLEGTTSRIGLEKPGGGGRNVTPMKMTYAEAAELRKTNFRKYSQMLREGKLNDLAE